MNSITKVPRESRWTRLCKTAALTAVAVLVAVPQAHANSGIETDWQDLYGPGGTSGIDSQSSNNAGCQLCHDALNQLNDYGHDLQLSGIAFVVIQGNTSVNINGGTTYLDEITASTQPGWTTDNNNNVWGRDTGLLEASDALPPNNIGTLDPGTGGNQPPVLDPIGNKSVALDGDLTFTVTASDDGLPSGTLTLSAVGVPTGATFTDNGAGDGTFVWNPATPAGTYPGVTFTASDGEQSDSETITITVGDVQPGDCFGITIDNADWRTQGGGSLRVSGSGVRDGEISLSAFDPVENIATTSGNNGKFNFNVQNLGAVPCRVRVEQSDVGLCGEADVTNVPDPNTCVPLGPRPVQLIVRGDTYATPVGNKLTVTASRLSGVLYNDFGEPPLTAALVTGPTAGSLNGTFGTDGSFTYTPGDTMIDNSVDQFTYQVTDGNGATAQATVTIQTLSKQVDFKITMNYELGMHCTGFEFAYCCVLPPYNSIVAQVIKPAQGDPTTSPCFDEECDDAAFLDGYPRLLEGDPNAGRDGLGRETVVRDWEWDPTANNGEGAGEFKKYQLRYYHDAQPRQEGNTGKPNTSTLISAAEGNSLQYFNTVFDSAAPDPDTNALVYGPYNNYENVLQGDGVFTPNFPVDAGPGGTTTDNYANGWLNHFYIYVDPATGGPNLEGHGNTGLEADKIRLGVAGQVAYPPNAGAGLQPLGPTPAGAFPNVLTFSADTGTVVYTQAKVLEDLPIMLTSPRIWEALGLPLTPFEDTIGFFADPGAVDEDAIRPYVAMKASLHDFPSGNAVMGSNQQPVIGFGTAPIDIPNCERCHSAPSVDPVTNLPNVNSPNWNRADASYPHAGPLNGTGLEDMTNLEINFWLAYYDIVPGVDSTWYPRLKGAAINMLTLHDDDRGTEFTINYPGTECRNAKCNKLTNEDDIPQNTRLGAESVICQRCHADNVIANVKSGTFDAAGLSPIPPITEAIHNQHRNKSEGGVIVFNDSLGRDGGCQGCHPAHRSDGVMDGYPITLGGDNFNADGDNRLNPGGCFVGRDVHSNPMKDADLDTQGSHLNAVGAWLLTNVAQDQGEWRGIWCTNCHSQLGQELWRTEDCDDLIRGDCVANPRGAETFPGVVAAINEGRALQNLAPLSVEDAIDFLDPKVPGVDLDNDRTTDQTHAAWNPAISDAGVATIEVGLMASACSPLEAVFNDTFGVFVCVDIDADGDPSVNILSWCTTPNCVDLINDNRDDQSLWRYPENPFQGTGTVGAPVPFNAATDGRDHWLSAGEPHCADCHAAPYTEQSGNINPFPPFNYPAKASLMRYSRGHQDVTCQGCHESIHGLYPVTPTIDTTSYAQAAALNTDGSHGPIKCEACHTHVDAVGIPTWVDNLRYNDPTTPGNDNEQVAGSFDTAVSWMHTYTDEADPAQDVCQNCHGPEVPEIDDGEYLEHAMLNRVSRVAMDNAERAVNNGLVYGEIEDPLDPDADQVLQRNQLCTTCHEENELGEQECDGEWREHLIQGRVSEVVWEELSAGLTPAGCGW